MKNSTLFILFIFIYSSISAQNITTNTGHFHVICNDRTTIGWGGDGEGELGDGTFSGGPGLTQANSLTGIVAISAGASHCIALKSDSTVWAWGGNPAGQLGNGTQTPSNVPIQVASLSGIIAITAGGDRSFAVKNDGTVWGWGNNGDGALGNGSAGYSNIPVQVNSLTGIIAVATAPGFYSLALKNDGTVWAWGNNDMGYLGNGTLVDSYVPIQVNSLTGIIAIAAGDHALALKNDGTVWAWGRNDHGQLGDGTTTPTGCFCKSTPVQSLITGVESIAASSHSLALKKNGTVWAWGDNRWGQFGNGTHANSSAVPIQINSITDVAAITASFWTSMALKNDGTVWTWGAWGNETTGDTTSIPMKVNGLCQVAGTLGIEKTGISETEFNVYPNPSSKTVTIHVNSIYSSAGFTVKITDSLGKTVYTEEIKEVTIPFTKEIDLSSFAKGVYFIDLLQKNKHSVQKIVLH